MIPPETDKKKIKDYVRVKIEILWQGNPMSCVKTFGTRACKLCSKERSAILKLTRKTPNLAINKCNEVYGACRHKPRFHRFNQSHSSDAKTSTDESVKDKRVTNPSSTTSARSTNSDQSDLSSDSESSEASPFSFNSYTYNVFTQGPEGSAARSLMVRTAYHGMTKTPNPDDHHLQHQHVRHVDDQGDLLRSDSTFVDV